MYGRTRFAKVGPPRGTGSNLLKSRRPLTVCLGPPARETVLSPHKNSKRVPPGYRSDSLTGQRACSTVRATYFHRCVTAHAFRSRQRARASRRIWLPRPLLFFRLPEPVPWPTPFLPRLPLDCAAASRSSGELPVSAWLGLGLGLGLAFGLGSIGFGFGLG